MKAVTLSVVCVLIALGLTMAAQYNGYGPGSGQGYGPGFGPHYGFAKQAEKKDDDDSPLGGLGGFESLLFALVFITILTNSGLLNFTSSSSSSSSGVTVING